MKKHIVLVLLSFFVMSTSIVAQKSGAQRRKAAKMQAIERELRILILLCRWKYELRADANLKGKLYGDWLGKKLNPQQAAAIRHELAKCEEHMKDLEERLELLGFMQDESLKRRYGYCLPEELLDEIRERRELLRRGEK